MKRYIPNAITLLRIVGTICLLFLEATPHLVTLFWLLYAFCGLTDIADGFFARKLHAVTKLGKDLDSVADLCFVLCCIWKLYPLLHLTSWMWGWIILIAAVKIINGISALVVFRKLIFLHTFANKISGFLLYILTPIFLSYNIITIFIIVAITATFAAIEEGHHIRTKHKICYEN